MSVLGTPTDQVLRTADGSVIDLPPDLVHSERPGHSGISWVTSWYPRPGSREQLDRVDWARSQPRGHVIPLHTASGDIVEFGLAQMTGGENPAVEPSTIVRWFGWLNYGTDRALVIKGPYSTLDEAARQAAVVVDLIRLDQIDPDRSFDASRIDPTKN